MARGKPDYTTDSYTITVENIGRAEKLLDVDGQPTPQGSDIIADLRYFGYDAEITVTEV